MLVNFVLILTTLFMFLGFAIDVARIQLAQQQMQYAADAAALGAMFERQRGKSDWLVAGRADAALNGFTNGSNGVTVNIDTPTSGAYSGASTALEADISQSLPMMFLGFIHSPGVNSSSITVNARAVAQPGVLPTCVYALDTSSYAAISINGLNSITMGCGVVDNSNMQVNGINSVVATSYNVAGSYNNVGFNYVSPTPLSGVSPSNDPLSYLTAPNSPTSTSQCNFTGKIITGNTELHPGTYCGSSWPNYPGLTINGSPTLTLDPGLYIITNGISWNGSPKVIGNNVTLYFTKGPGSVGYGNLYINGNVQLTMTAPNVALNGSIPGIVMFSDRNWTGGTLSLNGILPIAIDGILYLPGLTLSITGLAASNGHYLGIVVNDLSMTSGAYINIPTGDYSQVSGGSPFKGGAVLAE